MPKIEITTTIILLAIILSACGTITPYPTPTAPSATLVLPTATPLPRMTSTPTITPTFQNTQTPETLYGYPTPEIVVWPTCTPGMDCLALTPNAQRQDFAFHELYVGKYVLRKWCNIDPQFPFPSFSPCAVTISSKGTKQIEIWGFPAEFGEMTGADLTGQGKPDIVIFTWSGGTAGGATIVYEAGDSLRKILSIGSFVTGTFTDLDGNGTYEYIDPTRFWPEFCGICQLRPQLVFEYQPASGYALATYKFKDFYSAIIQEDLEYLNQYKTQNPSMILYIPHMNLNDYQSDDNKAYQQYANYDYDHAVKTLYELVYTYLLTGQTTNAQEVLTKYCPPDKVSEYMLGIQKELPTLPAH